MSDTIRQSDGKFLNGLFFRVLPAQIFLLMFTGINNMINGLIGANLLGARVMSAIGLYSPFQMIWMAVGSILMVSSQVLCARYMGSGDLQRTRGVFSLNLTVATVASAFAMLLSIFLSRPIATILGATSETAGDVSGYIVGRGLGLIPMVLGMQVTAFLSLEGQDKRNYIATGAMLATSIALAFLFAGALKMGITGLGVATSLSQWVSLIVGGLFFLTPKASLKYSIRGIHWKALVGMLKIGLPSAMVFFLTAFRNSLFNNLLAAYDPSMVAIAAVSTYAISMMVFESVGKGIAGTGRLLASVYYGEEDGRSLTSLMKTIFTKGLLITLAASVLTFLLADLVTGLFYPNPASEVYQLTARGLRFGAVILILQTVAAVFSSYYSSIGRNVVVNVMAVLEGIAAMAPFGLLLIPRIGFDGVLYAYLIGYAIVALCGPIYAIIYWKRLPGTLGEWLTIPANFGVADDERLDASIHSLEDALTTSEAVRAFCRERRVDEKKAYYSALAVEELCLGIIKDRFDADDKKHTIEVRVLHKGENIFMSLKDDCKPFNARERADLVNPRDDSPKSISIRVFMGIAKETEYQFTLGINVFTVTV